MTTLGASHGGWAWPTLLVVGLALLVVGLVLLRRVTPSSAPAGTGTDLLPRAVSGTARAILDERLARGEIDTDEYRRRRSVLDGG